jgi:hypothetical protein
MIHISDKEHLVQECCRRLQEAKADAAAIAAQRLSDFHDLIEETYSLDEDDSSVEQLYKLANSAVAKANEEMAHRAEEFGVNLQFGPSLAIDYGDWPQYVQHCSDNDRWRAERRIRRIKREAAAQIEHQAIDTLIQVMDEHLGPAEATMLVDAIPAAADLVPELKREDLEGEQVRAGGEENGLDSSETPF